MATTTKPGQARDPYPLPTVGEIELADFKLSSVLSDLSDFVNAARKASGGDVTMADVRAKLRAGEEIESPGPFEYDAEAFARLLVFAADLEIDGRAIADEGAELLRQLRSLHRDEMIEFATVKERSSPDIRSWLEASLRYYNGGAAQAESNA